MRHPELQKQLLVNSIELMLQKALNSGPTHKASKNNKKQLAGIQERDSQEISVIKQSHCKHCGSTYSHLKGKYPTWGTTCLACGKKNHRAKMYTHKNETKRDTSKHEQHKMVTETDHVNIILRNAATKSGQ